MAKSISTFDLANIMKSQKVNLIDIREVFEHRSGHAEGAVNVPLNEIIYNADKHLNKNETYYIICQSGGRSGMAVQHLARLGYDVIDVMGGHGMWPENLVR